MARRELVVRIVGDNKSLLRAFATSSRGAKQFDRDMGRVSRGALAGSGALGGLSRSLAFASGGFITGAAALGLVRAAFTELNESRRVTAQTNAVIKSTGEVAGVTAEHVDELGQALLRKTGIDDEAIRSSENLLLTFTNVRNVIGDGNDVFDQATQAILDMSVAMGGDLEGATIRVGKALQDPIKGVTALRRVGVLLTESQQRQIAAFVRTGRVMDAQKIILRELTREFGGSAAAAGNVQPWNLLRESILNVSATIAEKFLPKIQDVSERLQTWLDNPQNVQKVEDDAEKLAGGFESLVNHLIDFNNRGNKAMDDLRVGVSASAEATRVGLLRPFTTLGGPIGDWAERERNESLAQLNALRAGVSAIAVDMRRELEEALQLKNTQGRAPGERGAEPPGRVTRTGLTGLTAAQRNRFFDNDLSRALDRVQDATLRDQLSKLDTISASITARIKVTKDITRKLNLEDQLVHIRRTRKGVLEQIADNARASAEDAKSRLEDAKQKAQEALEAAKEAQRKIIEARNSLQFRSLGLSATGGERTPGLKGLREQLGSFEKAVEGTFLDTKKTETVLSRIRKVLVGGLGAVSEEVRAVIRDMLRDLKDQLKQADREITRGRALNVDSVLAGLGLDRDTIKALRGRLSHVGASGRVLPGSSGPGAFGFALPGGGGITVNGPITVVANNPDAFERELQKKARRKATQTTGPHAGNASGFVR